MDYVAKVGLNFPDKDSGEDVRVEAGEPVAAMSEDSLAAEIAAGNVVTAEEWAKAQEEADVALTANEEAESAMQEIALDTAPLDDADSEASDESVPESDTAPAEE